MPLDCPDRVLGLVVQDLLEVSDFTYSYYSLLSAGNVVCVPIGGILGLLVWVSAASRAAAIASTA